MLNFGSCDIDGPGLNFQSLLTQVRMILVQWVELVVFLHVILIEQMMECLDTAQCFFLV